MQVEYDEMINEMQKKFNENIKQLNERVDLNGQNIENFQEYFQDIKKNVANLLKCSKIIPK